MNFRLELPHSQFKTAFVDGLRDCVTDSDRSAWIYLGEHELSLPERDFDAFVTELRRREHTPSPTFVRTTAYWAITPAGEMVGRISIRHELNEFLKAMGGHIGYVVRPSWRRRGVATEMLRQLLLRPEAREIGRLLLTCDEDNTASEKSIRKNGGVHESTIPNGDQKPKKRFWITL